MKGISDHWVVVLLNPENLGAPMLKRLDGVRVGLHLGRKGWRWSTSSRALLGTGGWVREEFDSRWGRGTPRYSNP